ncbi:MAG: rhomboid family intramembrane serine protease [Parachlamydiaceae bacterium]|nr:rhomboid family intramembrane serine protease [Parachlamydiaceae bacterium]
MVFSGVGFFSFNTNDLLQWGANYAPDVKKGEYWRLLSNIFIHDGIQHLFLNRVALIFIGIFLEPLLGKLKLILVMPLRG